MLYIALSLAPAEKKWYYSPNIINFNQSSYPVLLSWGFLLKPHTYTHVLKYFCATDQDCIGIQRCCCCGRALWHVTGVNNTSTASQHTTSARKNKPNLADSPHRLRKQILPPYLSRIGRAQEIRNTVPALPEVAGLLSNWRISHPWRQRQLVQWCQCAS